MLLDSPQKMDGLSERAALLRVAIRCERLTIAWTVLAGALGLIAGTIAHSVSLTAFGLDGAVECFCAGVLLRRLSIRASETLSAAASTELRAARTVGTLLVVAGVYVAVNAIFALVHHREPDSSAVGLALTVLTIPIMVPLANVKLGLARRLQSPALRADAIGNVVCWYLALVALTSLVLDRFVGLWWIDGVASLIIVVVLIYEGVKACRA
ncbi:MAG: cation transporter [Candidatus Eremiobacteraeota bacterium]|nr:cation transporter [Candidatus Eremiobacteraeota bacterium]MBC5828164.1 cation transporter [Candidatus Eremiobacteraeota bacterium]